MKRRVVITGTGILSPLGDSAAAVHTALCEGRSALCPIESFSTEPLGTQLAGELKAFTPETYLGKKNFRPLDRTSRLAASAAQLTLDASGWTTDMRTRHEVGLILGTMFGSIHTIAEFDRRGLIEGPAYVKPLDFANTVINAASGQTAIWHHLRGVNSTIATGACSGLHALAYATDQIRRGRATALLTGGVEELCFESLYGFYRAGLLAGSQPAQNGGAYPIPFDIRRNGFALGEGSAFLMLEEAETAAARGAPVLAEVLGHGSGYDCSQGREDTLAVGALVHTIRSALQEAQLSPAHIDGVSASANGSILADRYEALALATVFGEFSAWPPVTAMKSMLGETLGASGAIQVVAFIEAMHRGILPGIHHLEQTDLDFLLPMVSAQNRALDMHRVLITSMSAEGNCCALVIQRT